MDISTQDHRPRTPVRGPNEAATLPRNFTFCYEEDQPPQTPIPSHSPKAPEDPPQPPRVRIKRRRPLFAPYELPTENTSFEPSRLPSIELSESMTGPQDVELESGSKDGFLAPKPVPSVFRSISPPRTPLAQISTTFGNNDQDWRPSTASKLGDPISRPSSTFSEMSNSSSSSVSSWNTFPSHEDSCTSPESDFNDPFTYFESRSKHLLPAIQARFQPPPNLQQAHLHARVKPKIKWNKDMDDHLWLTYITYLSDPKVTPFKTLPGTAPPLGVCHRVARTAKKTWKGPRVTLDPVAESSTSAYASLDATVMCREASAPLMDMSQTLKSDPITRSLSSTSQRVGWPRSSSSTRKRLRELCKRKPTLSPHYQRLMQSRSPPISDQTDSRRQFSSHMSSSESSSIFSTRDLNVTLATSTSASMQPGGLLSQLASEDKIVGQESPGCRANAHQKSQSLQSTLGIGGTSNSDSRQLASPFREQPERQVHCPPQLDSPLELHHPRPLSGSMKRRAQYQLGEELLSDDLDMRRNALEDLFRDPNTANGKRRVRSRGFSMGAMRASSGAGPPSRQLSDLFSPPAEQDQGLVSNDANSMQGIASHAISRLAPPVFAQADRSGRLGSPFVPGSTHVGLSNTFPRSLFPQGLDTISSLEHQRQSSNGSDESTSTMQPAKDDL